MRHTIFASAIFLCLSCTGGDGQETKREVYDRMSVATCDTMSRCGEIGAGERYETEEQCIAGFSALYCAIDASCDAPTSATSEEIESCELALLFQQCSAEPVDTSPAGCEEALRDTMPPQPTPV